MKKEIQSTLKKTAKIAGVTCVAAGAIAIVTSTAAVKAFGEGGKYLVNSIKKILKDVPQPSEISKDGEVCETPAEEETQVCEEAVSSEETL